MAGRVARCLLARVERVVRAARPTKDTQRRIVPRFMAVAVAVAQGGIVLLVALVEIIKVTAARPLARMGLLARAARAVVEVAVRDGLLRQQTLKYTGRMVVVLVAGQELKAREQTAAVGRVAIILVLGAGVLVALGQVGGLGQALHRQVRYMRELQQGHLAVQSYQML